MHERDGCRHPRESQSLLLHSHPIPSLRSRRNRVWRASYRIGAPRDGLVPPTIGRHATDAIPSASAGPFESFPNRVRRRQRQFIRSQSVRKGRNQCCGVPPASHAAAPRPLRGACSPGGQLGEDEQFHNARGGTRSRHRWRTDGSQQPECAATIGRELTRPPDIVFNARSDTLQDVRTMVNARCFVLDVGP